MGGYVSLTGVSAITALIDADSIIYIVAWRHKDNDDIDLVLREVDQFIVDILYQTQARQYAGFFTPSHYFRYDIATIKPYKGNRPESPEWVTKWKKYIIQHVTDKWGFVMCDNMEADDAVSIIQQSMLNTVICSPDKDLKQVPGNHFDYKKGLKVVVSEVEARRTFWKQMMVGDDTDNITGVPGIGEKTADKILDASEPSNYQLTVLNQFKKHYGLLGYESFEETVQLIRMLGPWSRPAEEVRNLMEYSIQPFDLDNAVPSDYLVPKADLSEPKTDDFVDPFAE